MDQAIGQRLSAVVIAHTEERSLPDCLAGLMAGLMAGPCPLLSHLEAELEDE